MKNLLIICILPFVLFACHNDERARVENETKMEGTVKIYKYDRSVQCEPQSGITLAEMVDELAHFGITVICAQKGHDGYARAQACGTDSGVINVYTINRSDLTRAIELGFVNLDDLPGHQLEECGSSPGE